jgi:hypothetical protein
MPKTKRFLFGVLSSLLLAAGFVRAADNLDPMSKALGENTNKGVATAAVEPCTTPCDVDDPT